MCLSIGKSAGSHMQIVHVNSMNFILVYISFKVMVMSLLHLDLHGVFRSWSPISYKPGLKPCLLVHLSRSLCVDTPVGSVCRRVPQELESNF